MTDDERFSLLVGVMGAGESWPLADERIPPGVAMSAGYVPGVPRLGVPALQMSDAGLGVTNPGYRPGDTATALPSTLALAGSFNPALARAAGEAIGREARSRGFNVQLAPAMNLARDPRNGRNFEYLSEDPLLSATMAAESINGIQAQGVISTVKHYSLNCNETNRHWLDAVIDPDAHRESDLLAFEIAIERSQPGAVMTAYNKVNGDYAVREQRLDQRCAERRLGIPRLGHVRLGRHTELGVRAARPRPRVRRADRRHPVAVRGVHRSTASRLCRRQISQRPPVGNGPADPAFDVRHRNRPVGPAPAPDMAAHNEIALRIAREGIVLLQNRGVLPVESHSPARIAVIGGYAHIGVPIGCGSSAVIPPGGFADVIPIGGPGLTGALRNLYLLPSRPLDELRKQLPNAQIEFDPGISPAEAVLAARRADIAIVFAIRVEGEGFDSADLSLPWGQDAVIAAVAAANPNTVVVLETGNPVSMPWRER